MGDRKRPGGEIAARPLHYFWIADCSGSMGYGGKIQSLNTAIREAIPHMQKVADENPNAEVFVRAIKFSSGAQWHISQPTPVDKFIWDDLEAGGVTDLGQALSMLAGQLKIPPMPERSLPPVMVLISDGQPTDDYKSGLNELMSEPWGKKGVRVAIAIGDDADKGVLSEFIDNPEFKPLEAKNPETLVRYIKWVSTAVLQTASNPGSQADLSESSGINVPIPAVPDSDQIDADKVW